MLKRFLRNESKLNVPFPITNISEDEVSGGVSKVAVTNGIGSVEVLTRCYSVEVDHVPDDEEGRQDVAEDEEEDDSEECVDAVLAMNKKE